MAKEPLPERVLRLTDRRAGNECWPWLGYKDTHGYGIVADENRRRRKAHAVALEVHSGETAAGRVCRHSCDNPGCVNPGHLSWGTQADNIQDMVERGRARPGQPQKLDEAAMAYIHTAVAAGASKRAIARYLGVSHTLVQLYLKGKTYRGIQINP